MEQIGLAQEYAPERLDILERLLVKLDQLGQFERALLISERAMAELGPCFETHFFLGYARFSTGSHEAAVDACRKGIAIKSKSPGVYVTLDSALLTMGKINEAMAAYKPATTAMCPVKNTAPVANAGPNQTVTLGTTVTLNGTASSDIDGNLLTYHWSLLSVPTGSGVTLTNPTTAKPTFLADKPGQYVAQLIVNDGIANSAPASVTIGSANTAPVANSGPNQTVAVGATVTLNGSGSTYADGNTLTYQ